MQSNNNKLLVNIFRDNDHDSSIQYEKSDFFNSFIYNDQLINNPITLNNREISANNQSVLSPNIKSSFNVFKQTRTLHMNALPKKYYPYNYHENKGDCSSVMSKLNQSLMNTREQEKLSRYKDRKQKEKSAFQQQKSDLSYILHRKSQQNLNHKSKVKSIQTYLLRNKKKTKPKQKDKQNEVKKNENGRNKLLKTLRKLSPKFSSIEKQNNLEEEYIEKLNDEIKFEVMKDGQYLIKPKPLQMLRIHLNSKNKRKSQKKRSTIGNESQKQSSKLSSKLSMSSNKSNAIRFPAIDKKCSVIEEDKPKSVKNSLQSLHSLHSLHIIKQIKQLSFELPSDNIEINPSKEQAKKVITEQEKKIMDIVASGNYFRAQIELSMNEKLLKATDRQNNNLLHICINSNQEQLFEMILKKSIEHKIDLFHQRNRFKKTPEDLGKIFSFFKNPSLLREIQKYKRYIELNKNVLQILGFANFK